MRIRPFLAVCCLATAALATPPSTQPVPLKLTLQANQPGDLAKQLSAQLGMPVQIQQNPTNPAATKYDGESAPFVRALADYCTAADLQLVYRGGNTITLMNGKPLRTINLNDNMAAVINYITINAQRSVEQPNFPTSFNYGLQATLLTDPSMNLWSVADNARVEELVTDPPITQQQPIFFGGNPFELQRGEPSAVHRLSVNLSSPTSLNKIVKLRLSVRGWVVASEAAADVTVDPTEPQMASADGLNVDVQPAVDDPRRPGGIDVKLTGPVADMYRDPMWQQLFRNCVRGLDADGNVVQTFVSNASYDATNKLYHLKLMQNMRRGGDAGQIVTVQVRLPIKLKSVQIPIELSDISLTEPAK